MNLQIPQVASIRNSLMLYTLTVAVWSGRKLDKDESDDVVERNKAAAGSARVNKDLLPGCTELKEVIKSGSELRSWFHKQTLPWGERNSRVGKVQAHLTLVDEFRDLSDKFYVKVDKFLTVYPARRAQAMFELNDLFNEADYPPLAALKAKFRVNLGHEMIANVDDFRIIDGLPELEVARLIESAKKEQEQRLGDAMKDAYTQLHEAVAALAERMKVPKDAKNGRFKEALLTNVEEIAARLERLNVTNDPTLKALASEAKKFSDFDAKSLRESDESRASAARRADDLAAKFKNLLN